MGARWWVAAAAAVMAACGGGSSAAKQPAGTEQPPGDQPAPTPTPTPTPTPAQVKPPLVTGDYAFYGTDQGLTDTIYDVSADEGGNVYVAGGAAVFAKTLAAQDFARFDASTSGLTKNCHDPSQIANATPPDGAAMCPIISVAGSAAGKAIIGFHGVGTDGDLDADWAIDSGGADVVTFDGTTMTRARHVFIASPPHTACERWADPPANTVCGETYIGSIWDVGRRKLRQVNRIVVNHDRTRSLSYGDVYMGGTHASLTILVANPDARGWIDYLALSDKGTSDPKWQDSKGIWEHHHPAIDSPSGAFLTGSAYAIALDPVNNTPWYANAIRIASLQGYAIDSHPTWHMWWGDQVPALPHLWIWQQEGSQTDASLRDNVSSMSFCADGTLWVGSDNHGLARVSLDRSRLNDTTAGYDIRRIPTPDATGGAMAVACDTDGSLWVGFSWGGFGRLKNGSWTNMSFLLQGVPKFVLNPVRSIQIDRWSGTRRVYLAHLPSIRNGPGGVTIYSGP
jgi:hypothetical protein